MSDGVRVLQIEHLTVYRYRRPVRLGEHRMMFRPREGHDLRLLHSRLEISPRPSQLRWLHDVFDNSVAIATFDDEDTTELRFDSTVTLEHHETTLPDYALEESASRYPFRYSDDDQPDLVVGLKRHHESPATTAWAARFVSRSGSLRTMALLDDISADIHTKFTYVRRDEKGVQAPDDTLERRSGSCRDFALLMIEAVRSLGLAARFVSGYMFSSTNESAIGSRATHAWMQVYLPGAGWVDFDPTNRIVGNRNLIRVAVAWDPGQVLPLWGTFVGTRSDALGMDVTVKVTDATPAPT